jgi:hypothetical protein
MVGTQLFSDLGLMLNQDWCAYSLRIYPTDMLRDHYTTTIPVTVALACAGIFLFTALTVRRQILSERSLQKPRP